MSKLQDGELGRKTREAVKEKRRMTTNYQNRQHGQHQQYQQSQCCRINTIDSRFYHVKKTNRNWDPIAHSYRSSPGILYQGRKYKYFVDVFENNNDQKEPLLPLLDLKSLCADQKKAHQSASLICREEKSIWKDHVQLSGSKVNCKTRGKLLKSIKKLFENSKRIKRNQLQNDIVTKIKYLQWSRDQTNYLPPQFEFTLWW